jgi:hypothetical protein
MNIPIPFAYVLEFLDLSLSVGKIFLVSLYDRKLMLDIIEVTSHAVRLSRELGLLSKHNLLF